MHKLLSPRELVGRRVAVMTWQTSIDGTVTSADPACCRFFGLTEEQLQAGVWKTRLHPDDGAEYLRLRQKAIVETTIYENTVRIKDAQDEYRLISVVLVPSRDASRLLTGWHAVARLVEGTAWQSA